MKHGRISVVTPTYRRPREVVGLLESLAAQSVLPHEVVLVDGAPDSEVETAEVVGSMKGGLPYECRYIRHGGGTAIQRNRGIDEAKGEFIAFLDDDIRPDPDFLAVILEAFAEDSDGRVGGIVGYRTNEHFKLEETARWRWYRRLGLLQEFEPGRYDYRCGYPINANMQPPFSGLRRVDFMTTSCAVWRREVFEAGLRFDPFFRDYGMLEDAHFSLRAGRDWELLQCGDGRCEHLNSPHGRADRRRIGYKAVVNYYYVFQDIVRPLTLAHKIRFLRFQLFELFRIASSGVRRRRGADFRELRGRLEGLTAVMAGGPWATEKTVSK